MEFELELEKKSWEALQSGLISVILYDEVWLWCCLFLKPYEFEKNISADLRQLKKMQQ